MPTWLSILSILSSAPIGALLVEIVRRKQNKARSDVDAVSVLTDSTVVMLKPLNDEIQRLNDKVLHLIALIDEKDATITAQQVVIAALRKANSG